MSYFDSLIRVLFLVVFSVLALWGCATTEDSGDTNTLPPTIQGMVFNGDNQPLSGVRVTLDEQQNVETDINGHYFFPNATFEQHQITLQTAGYEMVTLEFDYYDRSHVLYTQMISDGELVDQAAAAVEVEDWVKAEALLLRAESVGGQNAEYLLVSSILACHQGDYETALQLASSLESKGVLAEEVDRLIEYIHTRTASVAAEGAAQ